LGHRILAANPWLVVKLGDRVLIPLERARAYVRGLDRSGNIQVPAPPEFSELVPDGPRRPRG
jgi:hypothetical protein